jgi:hypothetical protein
MSIKYLHNNGANITADNCAIRWASMNGHLEVVKYLHENRIICVSDNYDLVELFFSFILYFFEVAIKLI